MLGLNVKRQLSGKAPAQLLATTQSTLFLQGKTMISTLATVLFGLAASLSWGSGDFCGGVASRRPHPSSGWAGSDGAWFVLLIVVGPVWREPFPSHICILAGAITGVGGPCWRRR